MSEPQTTKYAALAFILFLGGCQERSSTDVALNMCAAQGKGTALLTWEFKNGYYQLTNVGCK